MTAAVRDEMESSMVRDSTGAFLSEEGAFRARLREAKDTRAVCSALTTFARRLGFERIVVLLDERERGVLTVETTDGYPSTDAFARVRLRMQDERVAQLAEVASAAPVPIDVGRFPTLGTFEFSRAVAFDLRDASGWVGLLLAGHTASGEPWPETAPATMLPLLPDAIAFLRQRILSRVVQEDRAMLLAQKAEIEMLVRELRKRNDEMLDDLEQAREFQAQMLSKPPRVPGFGMQMAYRPLDAVSGDLMDIAFDGAKIRVFLSDTTGHGLRAGLATMLLKAEYESVKRRPTPGDVLRELNARIVGTYRSSALTMTAVCFDIDVTTGHVVYASAAHPSLVVVHEGVGRELPTGGTLIGLVPELEVHEGEATVEAGGGIYAYTDGITEAPAPSNELFGEERLIAAIIDGHPEGNAVTLLEKAAITFTEGGGFADDATAVGIKRD
jgi:serine phosphatase RsbU (regulator of sigma subunit)